MMIWMLPNLRKSCLYKYDITDDTLHIHAIRTCDLIDLAKIELNLFKISIKFNYIHVTCLVYATGC